MGLQEKTNGKFGGGCKSVKSTMKTPGADEKASVYDKPYHYPSGSGTKTTLKNGFGPSKQHDSEYMAKWRHVSDAFTESPMAKGSKKLGSQHTSTEGIKYFKPSNV